MKSSIYIIALCGLIWVPLFLIGPIASYKQGTFSNATVEIIASPYVQSNVLKYIWSGDIDRSCPIVIDRYIITSENVVITLKPSPLLPPVSDRDLGPVSFPISVETPAGMPSGPAVYQATERPRCTWLQRLWPPDVPYPQVDFVVTN